MNDFPFKISLSSGIIGIISVFTPVIFHMVPNSVYHFWLWGIIVFLNLNSNAMGISYNTELEFLVPGLIFLSLIVAASALILFNTLQGKKTGSLKLKFYFFGGIVMITSPIILMIIWQILYIVVWDYATFWGGNYYWPSFAFLLQFLAGILALLTGKKRQIK